MKTPQPEAGPAYALARRLLFSLDPERAHHVTLCGLRRLAPLWPARTVDAPCEVMGLRFRNRVGLAAGLDKDGEYIAALHALGFGFLELGTVTPRPQPGNPKPRLFRLPEAAALINRMGFNNRGAGHLVERVRAARRRLPEAVIGINIGKNRDTPLADAAEDYVECLREVYAVASYVTVNLSSPNTPGLRDLQGEKALPDLLSRLARERERLAAEQGVRRPLAVKLAPDLERHQVPALAAALVAHGIDAVIATNTTASRDGVGGHPLAAEAGGLSGAPLRERAARVLSWLSEALDGRLPLIAAGGIMHEDDAWQRRGLGAELVQLYSGLVYAGPGLIARSARRLA